METVLSLLWIQCFVSCRKYVSPAALDKGDPSIEDNDGEDEGDIIWINR